VARRTQKKESPIPERLRFRRATKADVRDMATLCNRIEELVIDGAADDDAELEGLLARWHAKAHRRYEPREFKTYYGAMSTEDFVRDALAPAAGFVSDLTFDEARAVFEAICTAALPEAETFHFIDFLEKNFADADVSDLIYWPNQWFEDESLMQVELSAAQMAGYAMRRSGRSLSGTPGDLDLPYPDPESA
jgi:hypothetical protein